MERQEKEHTGLVEYLTIVKRMVESDGLDSSEKVHLVVGNEACDLDSVVSALVYAFHLWKMNERPQTSIVPVLNIPQADYDIKTEVKFALAEQGIDQTTLVFADCRIDPVRLGNLGKLILTLVDHHVPVGKLTGCEGTVVEVIDHHPMTESNRTKFLRNVKLTIEPVGSCATLIAEKLLENPGLRTLSPITSLLLYETIVLDTVNFSFAARKATPKDSRIAEQLTSLFSSRFTRDEVFERLAEAKSDLSNLTVEQILRKDAKLMEGTLGKLVICSIPVLCQNFFDTDEKQHEIQKFCSENHLKGVVVLGVVLQGEFKKDILVLTADQSFLNEIVHQLCSSREVSLELYRDYTFQPCLENCQHFRQGNTAASQKEIVPLLADLLGSSLQNDNENSRKFADAEILREHPNEQQVPVLSPTDFGIQDGRSSGRSTPIHRIRIGNSPTVFDDEDGQDCDAVDEELLKPDLPYEGKRSPSPVYAQIDSLKLEHERMVVDAENGAIVNGGARGFSTLSGSDKNARNCNSSFALRKPIGLDVVDGNPTSIMGNHEAGNDESRPIMTASPAGFGATKTTLSSQVDSKSESEKDTDPLLETKNQTPVCSLEEDIIIDHTVAPPAQFDNPSTAPSTDPQDTNVQLEEDAEFSTDNQEIMLIVDGLKKSSHNAEPNHRSGPKSLPLRFSPRSTDYTTLRNGNSPSPKAATDEKSLGDEAEEKNGPAHGDTVDGPGLGHGEGTVEGLEADRDDDTIDGPELGHGDDTVDGLEPVTSSTSSSTVLKPAEKSPETSERKPLTPLEKFKLFDKETAHVSNEDSKKNSEIKNMEEIESGDGTSSNISDSAAEVKAAENSNVVPETQRKSAPSLYVSETTVLFQTNLLRPTKNENQSQIPPITIEGKPDDFILTEEPRKLPKTPDWETFESIANRRNQNCFEKSQFDEQSEKNEAVSPKPETSKVFTIVPDIPRSESVEKQKNVAKNSERKGMDEVDTGTGPLDTPQKSAENSGNGNIEKDKDSFVKSQPERCSSPSPDSAEWWKPIPRVENSSIDSSSKGETASLFMLEVEKEMEKRKAADFLENCLEMGGVGNMEGSESPENFQSDCRNNRYPWMADLNPDVTFGKSEAVQSGESGTDSGNLDRTNLAIEEKNVDGSQKSPAPSSPDDVEKPHPGSSTVNDDHSITTHPSAEETDNNKDTTDGLPNSQPVHQTVENTVERKTVQEESKSIVGNSDKTGLSDVGPDVHISPGMEDLERPKELINNSAIFLPHLENQQIDQITSDADLNSTKGIKETKLTNTSLNSEDKGALVWVKPSTKFVIVPNTPVNLPGMNVIGSPLDSQTGLFPKPDDKLSNLTVPSVISDIIQQNSHQDAFQIPLPPKGQDETDTGKPLTTNAKTDSTSNTGESSDLLKEETATNKRIEETDQMSDIGKSGDLLKEEAATDGSIQREVAQQSSTDTESNASDDRERKEFTSTIPGQTSGENVDRKHLPDLEKNAEHIVSVGPISAHGISENPAALTKTNDKETIPGSSLQEQRHSSNFPQSGNRRQLPDHPNTSELTVAEKRLELFQFSRAQNQANEARLSNPQGEKDHVDSGGRSSGSDGLENTSNAHVEPKLKRQKISLVSRESSDTASMPAADGQEGDPDAKNEVPVKESTSFDGDCDSNLSSPTDLTSTVDTANPLTISAPVGGDGSAMKASDVKPSIKDQENVWAIDMTAIEPYKNVLEVQMDKGEISRGATVCFFACNLPSRSTPKYEYLMQNIFRYFMSTLDLLADHQCTLVYFNGAVPAANYPATSWLHQCYKMIDRRMQKNLQDLIIVHPNFWFKAQLQTIGRAFLSGNFYNKIRYIDTLESLQLLLGMEDEEFRQLAIPAGIVEQEAKLKSKNTTESPTFGRRFAMLRKCSF